MIMRMNRVERYLGQVVLTHTLLVLMVLLVILGFSEFMIQVGKLDENYTLSDGALYTLFKLPVYVYEVFPMALLIGALMGLGGLANGSELTVLRVTGWSIGRILQGVLKTALLMWLAAAIIGEWIAPASETYAKQVKTQAFKQELSIGSDSGFWLKEPQHYIQVGRILSSTELRQIAIYEQTNGNINGLIEARRATYEKGRWTLKNVHEQRLTFEPAESGTDQNLPLLRWQPLTHKRLVMDLPLNPEMLQSLAIETRYMSLVDLYRYIEFLQENDLDSEVYQLALWRKVAMPFVVVGMIAIVFPLIFGSQRQVSMGQRVFVGILIGMGFHLLNQLFGNLSVVYQLPAVIGAFLPALLMLMLAAAWLRRVR